MKSAGDRLAEAVTNAAGCVCCCDACKRILAEAIEAYHGSKRFKPPTRSEVEAYCVERGNRVDAVKFIDFYTSKGWVVGKSKMKDWRAAVRTWERNDQSVARANNYQKFLERGE